VSGQLIALHSFRRGTGKSILAANLAVLLAVAGYRISLIDLDIASPSAQLIFGLGDADVPRTVNDYLLGLCGIESAAHDVTRRIGIQGEGRLFLIPSSLNPSQIAHVMRHDYDPERLDEAFKHLMSAMHLDVLLIDMGAGIGDNSLLTFSVSHSLTVLMRPDRRDYEGTGVVLELARRLGVPRLSLVVNQASPLLDLEAVRAEAARTYGCDVAAVLPHNPRLMALASGGIFVLTYPEDPFTRQLWQLMSHLTGHDYEWWNEPA
jgi:septum site-determining protein MinD